MKSFRFGVYCKSRNSFPRFRLSLSLVLTPSLYMRGNVHRMMMILLLCGRRGMSRKRLVRCIGHYSLTMTCCNVLYSIGWLDIHMKPTATGHKILDEMEEDFNIWISSTLKKNNPLL